MLDYETTLAYWQHLVDVRFRLLALVPTVTGIAVKVVADADRPLRVAIGLLGLLATLGLLTYDLRNSMLHDAAVHRLKELEFVLEFPRSIAGQKGPHGVFNDRPRGLRRGPLGMPVKHDAGLALVYAASIGAWIALITSGLLPDGALESAAIVVGGFSAVVVIRRLARFDRRDRQLPSPQGRY